MRSPGVFHVDSEIVVPFFDVDSMHIVWHGHYVKYLEVARCALLDRLGGRRLPIYFHSRCSTAWSTTTCACRPAAMHGL